MCVGQSLIKDLFIYWKGLKFMLFPVCVVLVKYSDRIDNNHHQSDRSDLIDWLIKVQCSKSEIQTKTNFNVKQKWLS